MVTVAVLTADQRLGFQIHTWLKDLADTIRLETHSDLAAFAQKIETENATEVVAGSKSGDEAPLDAEDIGSGKSQAITDAFYRLLVVDLDLLNLSGKEAAEWAGNLKQLMLRRDRSDPNFPTRVLFLAFEGGGFKIDNFRFDEIDDLIIKPLDQAVFLQKIELMTSDDPTIKPTYLFRQQTKMVIEIGKDAVIEEISEFALAIRNPAPLSSGVFAAIHASIFGQADLSRVIGRAYKSVIHPTIEGAHLVHFSYFGLRSDQLNAVKKFVRDRQPPMRARPHQPTISDQDPTTPFNRVAVVDMNMDVFHEIQSALKDHYVGVESTHYLSYARLLAALKTFYPVKESAPAATTTTAAPVEPLAPPDDSHGLPAWTMEKPLDILILSTTLELLEIESRVENTDSIFARTGDEWMANASSFFAGLDKQDANELQEMISYAMSGGKGRAFLKMKDLVNRLYYVEAEARLGRTVEGEEGAPIHVQLRQIDKEIYVKHVAEHTEKQLQPQDLLYDAIYIDVNLIRGDIQPWFDGLHESYMKASIVKPGQPMPKIILLAEEKAKNQPEAYRNKAISDYLYKPIDRKMMSYKAKVSISELIPRKEPEIQPHVRTDLPAKLAKDATMEELSEYGLSIAYPTPFRKGSMVRFFSPLLGGGVDGVLGRCSHCELKEDKTFLCHFVFFGTPDEILKRVRTWIREDYVHRKEAT